MMGGSSPTARRRRFWFDGALGLCVLGALCGVGGFLSGNLVLAIGGLLATILATVAMALHLRLGDGPFRTRVARAKRLRLGLVTCAAAMPFGLAVLSLAFDNGLREIEHVSGKPVEVRSDSWQVFMPNGRDYAFQCGEGRGRRSDCPALAKWRALPRWPEPAHVEMEVSGRQIRSLRMDGQVIVDLKADNDDRGKRATFTLIGLALICGGGLGVGDRLRRLADLKSPRKRDPRTPKGSPTPPAPL